MQFRLRTLWILLTAFAVFLALAFSMPMGLGYPILTTLCWLSPSFWIAGAIYAQGRRRAFFIGGIASGWLPHIFLVYYLTMNVISVMFGGSSDWDWGGDKADDLMNRVSFAIAYLAPGAISILGGFVSCFVHDAFHKGTGGSPESTAVANDATP